MAQQKIAHNLTVYNAIIAENSYILCYNEWKDAVPKGTLLYANRKVLECVCIFKYTLQEKTKKIDKNLESIFEGMK